MNSFNVLFLRIKLTRKQNVCDVFTKAEIPVVASSYVKTNVRCSTGDLRDKLYPHYAVFSYICSHIPKITTNYYEQTLTDEGILTGNRSL